jgi:DNA-binding transcriptional MerR regulator
MNDTTLTHKDLAELLGVSETTVKSYRRKFPGCIPVASRGKPIRFTAGAGDVALRIRDLFALGMSVEEVRLRLGREFPGIATGTAGQRTPRRDKPPVAPELAQGVSNMAKSMVAMAQQQKSLLARMQGIEAMLEGLGLQGPVDAGALHQAAAEASREKEARVEARLDHLDAASRELSETLSFLARRLERFLAQYEETGAPVSPEQQTARRIPLRREEKTPAPQAPASPEARALEPPRPFLALPLVARTDQGHYISAGGRSRGRFCLNDLKAMLAYGFTPPHHFTLKWEARDQGWLLLLEQASPPDHSPEDPPRTYRLRLMELPTQKGNAVAEILELHKGDDAVHPVEICAIINSLGE